MLSFLPFRQLLVVFFPLLAAAVHAQLVTHRWSFNSTGPVTHGTVIPDAISAAPGVIVGAGCIRTGSVLTLPGTLDGNRTPANNSAYFDLPNGIISSKSDLTVEIWATVHSAKNWQRLFEFGEMNIGEIAHDSNVAPSGSRAHDSLMFAACRGTSLSQQRLSGRIDYGTEYMIDGSFTISTGTQYHFVSTFQRGVGTYSANGGRLAWYRNGTQMGTVDLPFTLSSIQDVNNWLGRSQWSNDSNSHISYNEVRLYDHVLSPTQISSNTAAGPDANIAPTVQPDAVTMLRGQKTRVPVLDNDTGEIVRSTLVIETSPTSGSASISADGSILYTHTTGKPAGDSFVYRVFNSTGQSSTGTVTITFSETLKITNSNLDVPATPPASTYTAPNAFGNLTFTQPLCIVSPPGDTQRVFVCEKTGIVRLVSDITATPSSSVFLNLKSLVDARATEDFVNNTNLGDEQGLLGLAFHPDYATNRYFYIFYSLLKNGQRHQRVSRFTTQSGNPNAPDLNSEFILIDQWDDGGNHNGGDLHFGPDGYLYISVGDEGGANDTYNNSQAINKDLFTGVLRIDVDKKPGNIEPTSHAAIPTDAGIARFSIPLDNPFVHTSLGGSWDGTYNGAAVSQSTVRREFWATGLRNPWRMSFDPETGVLWCGEVGQGAWEEINIITRGANYGWAYREGNHSGPKGGAPANFDSLYHDEPIYEYPRSGEFGGYSVTGGRVYRGTRIAALTGKYIFGDYGSGNIWSMNLDGSDVQRLLGEGGIAGFGYDPSNQDILMADLNDGVIRRLTSATAPGSFPATLSATGLFADLSDLSPSPGLIPYDVNLPFWSDNAIKSRWVVVPDGTSQFGYTADGLWSQPAGTIWVKHFDMEMERGNSASHKRIETRLLVKNAAGAYGVSYRWNEEQTEAFLVADAGDDFVLDITDGGNPAPQNWHIPSRAECLICHTPQAGHALSFNTRQLNLERDILGFTGNQLDTLHGHGFLDADPGSPNLLPRHLRPDESEYSTEARVRSYLAVNCSYCHKDGGTAPASWDGRPQLTLDQTGLVHGSANSNGGDLANKLVVPGDTAHSIVLHRMAATGGFTRMPPIATSVIDTTNVALVTEWINGALAARQTYSEWRAVHFDPSHPDGDTSADPDNDGITNQGEYLAGTDPNNGASALRPQISGNQRILSFEIPANRSFRIDTTTNLQAWTPWDVPGNAGLPIAGGLIEFTLPTTDPRRFFRIELQEN